MSDELPAIGVAECGVVLQFPRLGDVVQEDTGEDQVAIQRRIELADGVGDFACIEGVLEQSADPGMMKALGGRRPLEETHQSFVFQVRLEQGMNVLVSYRAHECREGAEHLVDVLGRHRKQVGNVKVPSAAMPTDSMMHCRLLW